MENCSIIVLNWNGLELLRESLPSVIKAVDQCATQCEIIVVDNGSNDGSVDLVAAEFPSVKILPLEKNLGFGEGNNRAVAHAKGDIIVLLNNDMIVDPDFLKPLLQPFKTQENIFAVGCQIYFQDRTKQREETGKTSFCWDLGMIAYFHQNVTDLDVRRKYTPIFWASGGAAAYDRKKFLDLGGFRSIYSPAYVEDADISYRAWKRGWIVVFSPASIVYHKHRASSSKRFSPRDLSILIRRNHLLFLWANLSSRKLLAVHGFWMLYRLLKSFVKRGGNLERQSFIKALPLFFQARRLNRTERLFAKLSDEDIIKRHRWRRDYLEKQDRLSVLFVCSYVPCLGMHATGNRMFHIAKEMSDYHDIHILTFVESDEDIKRALQLKEFCKSVRYIQRRQYFDEPDSLGLKPTNIKREFAGSEIKTEILQSAISGEYDVIQFEYLQMAYIARLIRRFGIPMIWVDHEIQHAALWTQMKLEKPWSPRRIGLFIRWMYMLSFELSVAKLFDHTIVVTKNDDDELKAYLPNLRTSIVPLGVDMNYFSSDNSPRENSSDFGLLYTGYFRHYPNVDAVKYFVSDILPLIQREIPQVMFFVVGYGPPDELKLLENKYPIKVTGWVPDLRPFLHDAAVYVAPIRLGVGIRGKILEALAMEKPVVATSLASRGIPTCDGQGIEVADSPELFAEKVVRLLRSKDLRINQGLFGRKLVSNSFSWQAIADLNTKAIIHSLL